MSKLNSKTSRRDFIRNISLGTAALQVESLSLGEGKSLARKTVNLALHWLGWGVMQADSLLLRCRRQNNAIWAGCCHGHPEKGEAWAAKYNLDKKKHI